MKKEEFDFSLPYGEKVKLDFISGRKKKFVACSPPFKIGNIKVDELFFRFTPQEQVAIIYHELWHYHNNLKFEIRYRTKKPWLWLFFFINKPILFGQEFEADLNGAKKTDKNIMLSVLYKLKGILEGGQIPKSHEKTHPSIDERIEKIKSI